MNKITIVIILAALSLTGFWTLRRSTKMQADGGKLGKKISAAKAEQNSYWTCPMHPQIHQDHAGVCPICHMKLVKVSGSSMGPTAQNDLGGKRASIQPSDNQLKLIGVQKTTVEKMSLTARIPISGRMTSSSSVAFQVYEKDLSYVRTGLSFTGESSSSSDESIIGTITSVDSFVDPTSRTVRVLGSVKKGPRNLLTETSFSGEIRIELKNRLGIPESSVLHTGTGDLVYLFGEENRLTPKAVKLGIKTEGFYEVLRGVNEGDIISSGPNFLIDSEAKIRGAND